MSASIVVIRDEGEEKNRKSARSAAPIGDPTQAKSWLDWGTRQNGISPRAQSVTSNAVTREERIMRHVEGLYK
jgi:hypothetical protein